MKNDISKLFTDTEHGFMSKINPTHSEKEYLKQMRKQIRIRIRERFSELRKALLPMPTTGGMLFNAEGSSHLEYIQEDIRRLTSEQKKALSRIEPKFMSQGSFVYDTMNRPCHMPPQQMDLDDGVYLPIEMFEDKPVVSKDLLFKFVDRVLKDFAEELGDGAYHCDNKNTCCRLVIGEKLHIDVPLYAVPMARFEIMTESFKANTSMMNICAMDDTSLLQPEDINLALRNHEAWTVSDPALLNRYFKSMFSRFQATCGSDVCRQVSRILKAWRDHTFISGGPSSIALMSAVIESFLSLEFERGSLAGLSVGRALYHCTKRLPEQLLNGIHNAAEPDKGELLFPRSSMRTEDVTPIIGAAENLSLNVNDAVNGYSHAAAVSSLRSSFGNRIPEMPYLIAAVAVAESIRSQPALATPERSVTAQDAG